MRVKLYSTMITNVERSKTRNPNAIKTLVDQSNGTFLNYVSVPEAERTEELLGEFEARNDGRWIVVNTDKRPVRVSTETLTKATEVNIFRVEEVI